MYTRNNKYISVYMFVCECMRVHKKNGVFY